MNCFDFGFACCNRKRRLDSSLLEWARHQPWGSEIEVDCSRKLGSRSDNNPSSDNAESRLQKGLTKQVALPLWRSWSELTVSAVPKSFSAHPNCRPRPVHLSSAQRASWSRDSMVELKDRRPPLLSLCFHYFTSCHAESRSSNETTLRDEAIISRLASLTAPDELFSNSSISWIRLNKCCSSTSFPS